MEKFDRFLPVGFYYKAFHTPRWLFPFYENQMRQVAGLGHINPTNAPVDSPKDYAFCDLLIVGAGPAGLSSAIAAAGQGLDVLLVEEQPRPEVASRGNEPVIPPLVGNSPICLNKSPHTPTSNSAAAHKRQDAMRINGSPWLTTRASPSCVRKPW